MTAPKKYLLSYNCRQYIALSNRLLCQTFTQLEPKVAMKHARYILFTVLRLLTLTAFCAISSVYADDYSEVNLLLRAGKLNEAMVKAEVYLAAKPRDPQMRFLKGVIQRNSGKQTEAISTFTKLIEDYPELPEPYNNLAVLYAGQSQYDKARAALEMAIRTNPSYATAHENLGDVYARLASQAYNKALQLDGSNVAVPPKLALIHELFSPGNKGQRPSVSAPVAAPVKVPASVAPTASMAAATPIASASASATQVKLVAKPAVSDSAAKDVEAAVRTWANAWSAKDLSVYLGAYGKEFTPATKQSRSAWEEERRQRIVGKSHISVKLENLTVTINNTGAIAKFRQDYRADKLAVSSRKTLDLQKIDDRWLIVKESTGS